LKISIAQIVVSKDNPRQSFDEEGLRRLGESIKEHGQLQSIIVRSRGSGYELVVGERRLRACALLGLSEIEADVKNVDDVTAMELRLIENTQREDLSDAEKGDAVLGLWANYDKYETLQDVAKAIGSTIGTVKHWTEFSRKLSDGVKAVTRARKLTDFQVRYLPKYPKYVQDKLVSVIADRNLTGRQVIVFLKEYDKTPSASNRFVRCNREQVSYRRLQTTRDNANHKLIQGGTQYSSTKKRKGLNSSSHFCSCGEQKC